MERGASADELRKAFRTLARKYHPDTAEDKETAEEKFKELNEAYEVLSDPAKRSRYDTLGSNYQHGADFRPPGGGGGGGFESAWGSGGGGRGGVEFGGTGFSDFFEAFFSGQGGRGGGGGFDGMSGAQKRRGQNVEADLLVKLEEVMHGGERVLSLRAADGSVKKAKVKIPCGVEGGQMIRLKGLGNPGIGGGKSGDLFLRVRLERHPEFRISGSDLYYDLELAPWEAVLGAPISLGTLHGRLNLKVPAATSGGTELRLRGKGLANGNGDFGDLYVVIRIVIPEDLSDEETELWREMARRSSFRPRSF